MKIDSVSFTGQYRSWHIYLTLENTYKVRVFRNRHTFDFFIWRLDDKEDKFDWGEVRKKVEVHPVYKDLLLKLDEVEKKMYEMLQVSEVEFLKKVRKYDTDIYLFGFRILSPVVDGWFKYSETFETIKSNLKHFNEDDYFVLSLRKTKKPGALFELAFDDYLYKSKRFKNEDFSVSYYAIENNKQHHEFFTHRNFIPELIKKVTEHESVRLETLYI
jgi:hypothetical protein